MFETAGAAYRSPTFAVQLFITMVINFGVNFGLEYATLSNWGKNPNRAAWQGMAAWRMNANNSCLSMDMLITTFAIGFMCTLLATGGTQKEVREKKCDVLNPAATEGGWWVYTPVNIRNLCCRSLATGLYITALIGLPSFLIAWACVGGGAMEGYTYTVFKGIWAMAISVVVYALVFPAAINKRNFPELEFEELMSLAAAQAKEDGGPPMIANPAHI